MRIGVISDTHDVLRQEVIEVLQSCELILHAGDVCKLEILEKLKSLAPTVLVRGNNDKELSSSIPKIIRGEVETIKYIMVHDKKDIPSNTDGINLVVFGHSHKYYEELLQGVYYLNPGSCGKKRFSLPITMAILEVVSGNMSIQKVEFDV